MILRANNDAVAPLKQNIHLVKFSRTSEVEYLELLIRLRVNNPTNRDRNSINFV